MTEKTRTGYDIRQLWSALRIEQQLPEKALATLWCVVGTYQPAPTQADARWALWLARADGRVDRDAADAEGRVVAALAEAGVEAGPARRTATAYPVYHAQAAPKWLGGESRICSTARQHLQTLLPTEDPESDSRIFHQDVVAVRDMLFEMSKLFQYDAERFATYRPDELIDEEVAADLRPTLGAKLTRARALFQGTRVLGRKAYTRQRGGERAAGEGEEAPRSIRAGSANDHRARGGRGARVSSREADNRTQSSQASGWPLNAFAQEGASTSDDADTSAAPQTAERRVAALTTAADDQKALRRQARLAPTAVTPGVADAARLPRYLVAQAVAVADTVGPLAWALTVLLLTTGLPVKRLLNLHQRGTADGDEPVWNPEAGTVSFLLLDGPTSAAEDRRVVLTLPGPIQTALATASERGGVFEGVLDPLQRRLRSQTRRWPGPTPSFTRLRATAWTYTRANARDAVAASALRGEFGHALAAPAAYRRLDRSEIQAVFTAALRQLARDVATSEAAPPAWSNNLPELQGTAPAPPAGAIGSQRTQPAERFRPILEGLREAVRRRAPHLQPAAFADVDTVVAALNLWAAHTYLALLLASGLRPVGERTRLARTPLGWLVSDKNSPLYAERRLVPECQDVQRESESIYTAIKAFPWSACGASFFVSNDIKPNLPIPPHLVHIGGKVMAWRVHHDTFVSTAEYHGIEVSHLSRNATRHLFASALRHELDEAELDALLGHARIGADLHAPTVLAPGVATGGVARAIRSHLHRCGFRGLAEELRTHGLC